MITGIAVGDTFRCKHSTSGFYKVGKFYFVLSVGEDEFMMTDETGSAGNAGTGHAWSNDDLFWQTFERIGASVEREEKYDCLMEMAGVKQPGPDPVNSPSHYNTGGIECFDAMSAMLTREEMIGYLRGNSFKYRWRFRHKGGAEDLRKAEWYEKKLLDLIENSA